MSRVMRDRLAQLAERDRELRRLALEKISAAGGNYLAAAEAAWAAMDAAPLAADRDRWGAVCLEIQMLEMRAQRDATDAEAPRITCAGCGGTGSEPDGARCTHCGGCGTLPEIAS